jgi:hypothetical protein
MGTGAGFGQEDVYLLGCGRSVLDLTPEEVDQINRAPVRLALNKFAAFHDVAGIRPTHIWFTEYHDDTYRVLQYILDVCAKDGLNDLTIVMGHRTGRVVRSRAAAIATKGVHRLYFRSIYPAIRRWAPTAKPRPILRFPSPRQGLGWRTQLIRHTDEIYSPMVWAQTPDQTIFHHRTAFTAALNFLSALRPQATIRLIGVDFTEHGYFFDDEMKRRGIRWEDFTSRIQSERNGHFATIRDAVAAQPGTVFDVFPFMREQVLARGGAIVCSNPRSATIREGLADYLPILSARAELNHVGHASVP